ncbi:mCG141053, partial [Mus musculus]
VNIGWSRSISPGWRRWMTSSSKHPRFMGCAQELTENVLRDQACEGNNSLLEIAVLPRGASQRLQRVNKHLNL